MSIKKRHLLWGDKLTNTNLVILPSGNLRFSFSLYYKFIRVSFGFSPKFLTGNNDDNLKEKLRFFYSVFIFKSDTMG